MDANDSEFVCNCFKFKRYLNSFTAVAGKAFGCATNAPKYAPNKGSDQQKNNTDDNQSDG